MLFKVYNSGAVARVFFNGYFCASLLLSVVALYGFASGAGMLSTLSGFMYIVVVSLLSLNKKFHRSPFSIIFCLFTFLYLTIPTTFILFRGDDYIFGQGLASIPFPQSDYHQSLPLGFLGLTVFWAVMWFGIISVNPTSRRINPNIFSSIGLMPILWLCVIVLVVTWIENDSFAAARLGGVGKINSLLGFVFFDHACLVMVGLILLFKINETNNSVNSTKITRLISAIFIGFTAVLFLAGSKAAILVIFILFVICPFCIFNEYPHLKVSFLAPKFIFILGLLTLPLFYLALIQRISLGSGVSPDLGTLLAGVAQFDMSVVHDILNQIFYRFSQGGIDRFFLVFQSFVVNVFDPETSREFVLYLAKNTLNLILPGTIFPESYAPSSQLFPNVIQNMHMDGDIDSISLLQSLNTQPYTIFGIFVIIFGFASPVFLYLFTFFYVYLFNKNIHVFLGITMIYFFSGALTSYGIETVLGNSVHLFVSILLMYCLMVFFSQLQILVVQAMKFALAGTRHQHAQTDLGVEHRSGLEI